MFVYVNIETTGLYYWDGVNRETRGTKVWRLTENEEKVSSVQERGHPEGVGPFRRNQRGWRHKGIVGRESQIGYVGGVTLHW